MVKEHRQERRLEMLKQRYERRLQQMKDAASVGDRPMFHQKLTPDERLERWADPTLRRMIEREILIKEGPKALEAYRESMLKLVEKRG